MKPLLFLIFFAVSSDAFTQTVPEKKISVNATGISNGLSQGMINAICQDHFGFMWFGTMDGLNRYDGYKFQVFRNNSFDSTSISGNFITCIFEDSKGRLWIGTALNGINLFLPESEQFIHFTTNSKPALSNNTIVSIQEDKFGSIWIATQYGLNKLTLRENNYNVGKPSLLQPAREVLSFNIKQVPLTDARGRELFTLDSFEPSFLVAKSGTIWVSASHALFKILFSKDGKEKIETQENFFPNGANDKSNRDIYKIAEDTTLGLICFKRKDGFTIVNEKTGEASVWNCSAPDLTMVRNQIVFNNGILWERTPSGLFCFDMQQKKIQRIRSYNSEHDKILETPFSIYRDKSGIIWIGTGGFGLLRYNPRTEYFHKTATKSVTWMAALPTGDVLVMTPEVNYLAKETLSGQSGYKSDFTFNNKMLEVTKQYLTDMALQDKTGDYWINLLGIAKYNPDKKSYSILKKLDKNPFPFFLDRMDRLWYATATSFCLFNKTSGVATAYQFPVTQAATSPYKFCQVIYQDAKGVFWLGTTEGLFSFKEATGQWRQYKNKLGDSTSLSTNIVFSICDDPEFAGSYLWIGTNGGSLNRLCIGTGKFEHVGLKEGLPSMVVYAILADDDKQLWLSTNNGITCIKPAYNQTKGTVQGKLLETKFRYYYEENGLQSNEFNRYASCKTKDGILFFGGVSGFNYFNPKQVMENSVMPNVVITDFKISNRSVHFQLQINGDESAKKTPLSKPVFLTNAIELPYTDNMFSFDFTSLDYTSSEKNLYRYKLEGFDKEWIQSGNTNSATYTNLDPGDYTFTVKGSNSDGVWNERGTSIQLTILAPWYLTWWFRTLVLIFTGVLVYLIFRYRLRQKLKLFEIRNGIASDLHDEIGSTLSSVYIYSEVAQHPSNAGNRETNTYLKQISADTGNMIAALSDIVWTVDAKNDRFENSVNRMRATAVELFEAKGYNLHLEFTGEANTVKLGIATRKNFYLFYKEAITNAAKYACGKNIWITLAYTKPTISLCVKDDGKGFVADHKRKGNGLLNMQRRAVELRGSFEIISSPGNGTEVRLIFPV